MEWSNIIAVRAVNLNSVLSGQFSTSNDDIKTSKVGDIEFLYGVIEPMKKVSNGGDWTSHGIELAEQLCLLSHTNSTSFQIMGNTSPRSLVLPIPSSTPGSMSLTRQLGGESDLYETQSYGIMSILPTSKSLMLIPSES
jgi:hypothetical protein